MRELDNAIKMLATKGMEPNEAKNRVETVINGHAYAASVDSFDEDLAKLALTKD